MQADERRNVAVAGFLHGVVHANILAIPVFLAFPWRTEFRADDATLGLLAASAYACFGLGSVPFGHLSDRLPSRTLLAICSGGIGISLVAVALSPNLTSLAASLAALGFFSAIYHPTGLSLISRTVREQGRGMGWHGMGGSLGIAIGPAAVGGLLALGWPWRHVVLVLLAPSAVALTLLVTTGIREGPRRRPNAGLRSSARGISTRAFLWILLVYAFAGVAYWGSLTFLPSVVGAESYALLLALGAAGQVFSGYLADRPRSDRLLVGLSLAAALLLILMSLGHPGLGVAAAWAFGFLLFSLEPLQNTLVTNEVPVETRGIAFGMTFLSVFGIGSIGSIVAGILRSAGYANELFVVLAAVLATSGGFAGLAGAATRRRKG